VPTLKKSGERITDVEGDPSLDLGVARERGRGRFGQHARGRQSCETVDRVVVRNGMCVVDATPI
jgi:hypothetical protein